MESRFKIEKPTWDMLLAALPILDTLQKIKFFAGYYRQSRERQGSELCFRNASTTSEASGAHTTWTSCATVKPVESTNILEKSIIIHY